MPRLSFVFFTLFFVAAIANSATLDFSEISAGYQPGNTITLSNASVTTTGGNIYVAVKPFGPTGGFCGVTAVSSPDCSWDNEIDFTGAISNLSFLAAGVDVGDIVEATIYDGERSIATIAISSTAPASSIPVDFTGYSGITRLVLDDRGSVVNGISYGDFEFEATVPLPAAAWLFLSAIGGLGILKRKRL